MSDRIYIPTRIQIESIEVGTLVPDCFGNLNPITKLSARGNTSEGRAFICFYTRFGDYAQISGSLIEGKILRTVPLTCQYTSQQLDMIEERLRCQEQ